MLLSGPNDRIASSASHPCSKEPTRKPTFDHSNHNHSAQLPQRKTKTETMSLLRSSTLLHRLPTALPVSSLLAARFNSTNNPRDMAKKATEKLGEGFGEKTGDMLKEKMNEAGEMLERGKEKVKGMGQEVGELAIGRGARAEMGIWD